MKSICSRCRHFRPFRPMSQLLVRELGRFEQQFLTQVVTILQDERQIQDEEATMLVELLRRDLDRWDARPSMSDYCGLHESADIFLLHEVKNRDGDCRNFDPAPRPCSPCRTCRYRTPGVGPEEDQRVLAELRRLAINASAAGISPSAQDMANHLQLIGASKAFEAAQSYYIGRFLFEPPKYLSSCAAVSTSEEHIPCLVRNPDDVCADWSSCEPAGAGDALVEDSANDRELLEKLRNL